MQTVALGFAFGGQSQLLSKPKLLNGPNGGRPAADQIAKPQITAIAIQRTNRSLLIARSQGGLDWQHPHIRPSL
jgi:hypothetical protein